MENAGNTKNREKDATIKKNKLILPLHIGNPTLICTKIIYTKRKISSY
jgi:hypothetical protein